MKRSTHPQGVYGFKNLWWLFLGFANWFHSATYNIKKKYISLIKVSEIQQPYVMS